MSFLSQTLCETAVGMDGGKAVVRGTRGGGRSGVGGVMRHLQPLGESPLALEAAVALAIKGKKVTASTWAAGYHCFNFCDFNSSRFS